MTETELIKKIKKLKEIRPRKEWVFLTKSQILGTSTELSASEEKRFELFPFFRPVYAGLFSILILFGLFEFSQSALPGEPLYLMKRFIEKGRTILISEEGKPELNLEFANTRLTELNRIVQNNEVKKLASAINEFQLDAAVAAKNLTKVKKISKEIVAQTKKLEENKEIAEKNLATKIDTEEYDNALAQLVEREIKDLEERTLTEEQKEILSKAKIDFEAGNYSEALIKVLDLSQK